MKRSRPDVFAEYAKRGGPLPMRGAGGASAAFWRGYALDDKYKTRATSIARKAYLAGRKRAKAEPGIPIALYP